MSERPTARTFRWDDLIADVFWTGLARDERWGWHRGRSPSIELTNARATIIVLPMGQASPPHHKSGDAIIFQVRGRTEFVIEGSVHRLQELDFLVIPADAVYSYRNVGLEDSVFLGFIARTDDWPPTNTYVDAPGDMPTS